MNSFSPQVDNGDVILLQEEEAAQYQTQKQQKLKTPFTYFLYNENIMDKIVDHTNNKIN